MRPPFLDRLRASRWVSGARPSGSDFLIPAPSDPAGHVAKSGLGGDLQRQPQLPTKCPVCPLCLQRGYSAFPGGHTTPLSSPLHPAPTPRAPERCWARDANLSLLSLVSVAEKLPGHSGLFLFLSRSGLGPLRSHCPWGCPAAPISDSWAGSVPTAVLLENPHWGAGVGGLLCLWESVLGPHSAPPANNHLPSTSYRRPHPRLHLAQAEDQVLLFGVLILSWL